MHVVEKRTTLGNVSPRFYYGASSRGSCQGLRVRAIHTFVDSVLGHAFKATVENVAAKHSGGPTLFSFSARAVGIGLSAPSSWAPRRSLERR